MGIENSGNSQSVALAVHMILRPDGINNSCGIRLKKSTCNSINISCCASAESRRGFGRRNLVCPDGIKTFHLFDALQFSHPLPRCLHFGDGHFWLSGSNASRIRGSVKHLGGLGGVRVSFLHGPHHFGAMTFKILVDRHLAFPPCVRGAISPSVVRVCVYQLIMVNPSPLFHGGNFTPILAAQGIELGVFPRLGFFDLTRLRPKSMNSIAQGSSVMAQFVMLNLPCCVSRAILFVREISEG